MLVKWAIKGRRKLAKASLAESVEDQQSRASTEVHPSATAQTPTDESQITASPALSETTAQLPAVTAELERLEYQSNTALAKSSETGGDRAMRRIYAEERASSVRDDKLLSLTGVGRRGSYQGNEEPSQLPLTHENMQKLEHEGEPATTRKPPLLERLSSEGVEPNSQCQSEMGSLRPTLSNTRMESEQTVTTKGRNKNTLG